MLFDREEDINFNSPNKRTASHLYGLKQMIQYTHEKQLAIGGFGDYFYYLDLKAQTIQKGNRWTFNSTDTQNSFMDFMIKQCLKWETIFFKFLKTWIPNFSSSKILSLK